MMAVNWLALAPGDVVSAGAPGAGGDAQVLFAPGARRWYALRVAPQSEDRVEGWLARRGVYAFHPVLIRRVRQRGHLREVARRYLPGYVFAAFPGAPVVHRVCAHRDVLGAICRGDGQWGALDPEGLRAIHKMRAIDRQHLDALRAERIRRRQAMALRPGDNALFRAGPLAGQACEVIEIPAQGGARVRLRMFSGDVVTRVDPQSLVPLRRTG
jgi:transcription antitermination factor NusG